MKFLESHYGMLFEEMTSNLYTLPYLHIFTMLSIRYFNQKSESTYFFIMGRPYNLLGSVKCRKSNGVLVPRLSLRSFALLLAALDLPTAT